VGDRYTGTRRRAGRRAAWLAGAGLGGLWGCLQLGTFPCERDSQCELDGRVGICAEPGFCALPDDGCASGYRFHARGVPEDLAGQCATLPIAGSSDGGSSSDEGSTSADPTSSSTSSSSAGPASSSDGSTTTDHGCGELPCACTVDLAVGANHTCAVRDDGGVVCWGANNQGQMGSGTASGPVPELQTVSIPGEALAEVIHTGNDHVCVRASDEALWCWGRNGNDQIVPEGDNVVAPQVLPVEGSLGAVGLSPEHSCVGEVGGPGLQCLGGNADDELGGTGAQPIASEVPGAAAVDDLALGEDHSCARAGAQVWCWGSDQYGQLGQNMVAGPTPTKTEVALPGDAMLLVAGTSHTCAALDDGMAVRCWGRNNNGQIGDGTTNNRQLPAAIAQPLPAAVVAMDARIDTTCALLADGDLWCWGGIYGSELGIDIAASTPLTMPKRVEMTDMLPEAIVGFGVGSRHLCAHASSGRLWCWGRNNSWQVGPIDLLVVPSPEEVDVQCPVGG
jgi:alpha-tubulin suppressor-like RCC1 family protein